ncbi:hypothetical protein [Halorubellus salinus]|uniref:hypothetical protein n=1 Tax=Halorubellus salinus TaxID=755309 RepID=UPI001D09869E|nr:hypothetical protein [Halorubellus salinus]
MKGGFGVTNCCPHCDAAASALYKRTPGSEANRTVDPDKDWFCRDCGTAFDDPDERERRTPANTGGGDLASKLESMDPADLGGGEA